MNENELNKWKMKKISPWKKFSDMFIAPRKKKKKAQSSFSIPHKQPTNNSVDSVVTFYCWQFTQSLSLCHVLKYCHTFAFAMKPEITIK